MSGSGGLRAAALATVLAAFAAGSARAGGPLLVVDGRPVLWAARDVRGGPLNSQTVAFDAQGIRTVLYRVDSGNLGPLSNAQAVHLVDRIFGEYSSIPTAGIRFVNAGPILDPDTGAPVDVTDKNVGKFLSDTRPTYQNPIVFDTDGAITGEGGVLGFFGYLTVDEDRAEVDEAFVVLNGAALSPPNPLTTPSFLGVFTHEFGHFAGPLDHEQSNGYVAIGADPAALPSGFTRGQAYDLWAPFLETLYPFLFNPRSGATQSMDTGYFIATMDLDTRNALSNLYPAGDYAATTGAIEGRVYLVSGGERIGVPGGNVVARRISQGAYPPPPGTKPYPSAPTLDADGIPAPPPAQAATDCLATVSSAVTGLDFGPDAYRIRGLPPGDYLVSLQAIIPDATAGSGIGPLGAQLALPVSEEFYGGRTANSPAGYVPVTVRAGAVTSGIDLRVDGLDRTSPRALSENAPHFTTATALDLGALPVLVSAQAAETDPFALSISLPDGEAPGVHDLYSFTLTAPTRVWIFLDPRSGSGDLDLYLFAPPPPGATSVSLDDVTSYSAGPTAQELVTGVFPAGTWYVGVSAYAGNVSYSLRVLGPTKNAPLSSPVAVRPRPHTP